jgi:TonB-linked SusC/RagA family outer membrane protein
MKKNAFKFIKYYLVLFIMSISLAGFAQNVKISGRISDGTGNLPGVNVVVKGTTNGTITDSNGFYTINAPSNGTLLFSFVGYENSEVKIAGRTTIDVVLAEVTVALDEMVVVGYGSQKKRDLTGAISSVRADEIMQNTPTDVAQALQGRVAGVEIMSSSGEPGAESRIRIRGTSTFTTEGASPLFIVDGMEVASIDAINPQDIESMEVLKDAASAAIYGSKSANGVIIITTKRGKEGKARVAVNYMSRASEISHRIPQMNTREQQYLTGLRNFYNGNATAAIPDSLNPVNNNDFYYQELLYRRAWSNQVDLSISGGDKKLSYYVSAGFLDEQGIYINTFNKRVSSRVNVDYQASDKLKVGSNISLGVTKGKPQSGNAHDHLRRMPYWSVIDPDGSYTSVISSRPNPVAWANLYKNDRHVYDINAYNYIEYNILKGLTFKSNLSALYTTTKMDMFTPSLLSSSFQRSSRNEVRMNTGWTHEDLLTYNNKFGDHSVNTLAGFSIQDRRSETIVLHVTDNLTEALPISVGFSTVNFNNTKATDSRNRMASYFGRVNYSYKGKYLLSANMRRDGSSRFGSANRWGNFPSLSAGWRFSDEQFMAWSKKSLTDGKIRVSYGVTGNQAAGNFASMALYSTDYYADMVGFAATQLGNPFLGWETTKQFNYGLDLNFFNNRIVLAFDYYDKDTYDILYNINIPQTSGFNSLYQNVGSVNNKGWEINLNTINVNTRNFSWKTTFNLSINNNTVTEVPGGEIIDGGIYTLRDGWTIGTMYGYKYLNVFPWDQSNAFTPNREQLTPVFDENERFMDKYLLNGAEYIGEVKQLFFSDKKTPFKGGDVMWEDVNKDGVIDTQDRTIIGCGQPDFFGGVNSEWSYKGFSLSAFFQFAIGGDVYNYTEWFRSSMTWAGDSPNPMIVKNSWQAPGDVKKYYKSAAGGTVQNPRTGTSLWVEDGSYIRLKSLRLGYNLPANLTKKLQLGNVNAYVLLRDFFTWTKYSGFDPEVNSRNTVFAIGYDNNAYPRAKDVVLGLNINF